jgi:uncharacterized cupredoxin-like copper-binding protein
MKADWRNAEIQENIEMKTIFFWKHLMIILVMVMITACGSSAAAVPVTALSVEMSEFKFDPADFAVFAGKEVSLTLKNTGGVDHEFTILKKGVLAQIPFDREKQGKDILAEFKIGAKQSGEFKFTLPEAGEYQVICSIQGHMEAGMTGKITAQ